MHLKVNHESTGGIQGHATDLSTQHLASITARRQHTERYLVASLKRARFGHEELNRQALVANDQIGCGRTHRAARQPSESPA
jgi:hypothetical protein